MEACEPPKLGLSAVESVEAASVEIQNLLLVLDGRSMVD